MLQNMGKRAAVVGSAVTGIMMTAFILAGPASAQETGDPVTGAFTDMQAKIVTYGAAIVALVVVSAGIFLGIKYLRKGLSKA